MAVVSLVPHHFFHERRPEIWYVDGMPQISYTAMRICPIFSRYAVMPSFFAGKYVQLNWRVLVNHSHFQTAIASISTIIIYYAFYLKLPFWLVNTTIVTGHLPFIGWNFAIHVVISPVAHFPQGLTCNQNSELSQFTKLRNYCTVTTVSSISIIYCLISGAWIILIDPKQYLYHKRIYIYIKRFIYLFIYLCIVLFSDGNASGIDGHRSGCKVASSAAGGLGRRCSVALA